jgi:hypothetical protein
VEGAWLSELHSTLNRLFGRDAAKCYYYAGIDAVGQFLDEKLAGAFEDVKRKIEEDGRESSEAQAAGPPPDA